jgi:hypothetical protein
VRGKRKLKREENKLFRRCRHEKSYEQTWTGVLRGADEKVDSVSLNIDALETECRE